MAPAPRAASAPPQPAFRQFVLKVHSRCNLACTYCYVYFGADHSWRDQPMSVDERTVRQLGTRIVEHAERHRLPQVRVTLHGGEPLMVGHEGLRRIVETLRTTVGGPDVLEITLQTNGVLLDERFAEYLLSERVRVGISLDGGRTANDRHRLYAHSGSSYDQVVAAVHLMGSPRFRPIFAGILATVDVANEPVQTFRDLEALRPGRMDFLLPHATWHTPPPAAVPGRTVYGDWLVAAFDAWYDAPPVVAIRIFQEAMHALLGGASTSEAVGVSAPESVTIETNGAIEQTDALKIAYHGAPATGYNIFDHALDDVLEHPAMRAGVNGTNLSPTCRECPIVTACGGGLYPHRYRDGSFENPSVYCHDLARFIEHVQGRLMKDLAERGLLGTSGPSTLPPVGNAVRV